MFASSLLRVRRLLSGPTPGVEAQVRSIATVADLIKGIPSK